MKWFQLHTNSLYDPKIVKLIRQHGMAGYGVYMGINVLIAERDADDFTLEHDIEGLMTLFNEVSVQAIVDTCLSLGLLTMKDAFIQNVKISKYMGNWQKRSKPTEALQRPYVGPTAKKERKKEENEVKKPLDVKAFFTAKAVDRRTAEEKAFDKLHPIGFPSPLKLNAIEKVKSSKAFMRGLTPQQLKDLDK